MVSHTAVAVLLGAGAVAFVAIGPLFMWRLDRVLPWGISRRLLKGSKPIRRWSGEVAGAWNPARPRGRGNAIKERGWATYSLAADGQIVLDLVRIDGPREQFVGPPVEPPDGWGPHRKLGIVPSLAYLGFGGAGTASVSP
jgi:hypothetical protein